MADLGPTVTKEGFLSKSAEQKVKLWKQRWFMLVGGTLFYYNKQTNYTPAGLLKLQEYTIEDTVESDKKTFVLKSNTSGKRLLLSATTEEEKNEWVAILKVNQGLPPSPPPDNLHAKGKGTKYAFEASVASSVLGKKFIREVVDEDAWLVLDAFCSYLKEIHGEDEANKFRKNMVQVGTKMVVLYNNKLLSKEVLVDLTKVVSRLCTLIVDYSQMPSIFDVKNVTNNLLEVKMVIEAPLTHKLSVKSMQKFQAIFKVLSDEAMLTELFAKKKHPELQAIATTIKKSISRPRPANE